MFNSLCAGQFFFFFYHLLLFSGGHYVFFSIIEYNSGSITDVSAFEKASSGYCQKLQVDAVLPWLVVFVS